MVFDVIPATLAPTRTDWWKSTISTDATPAIVSPEPDSVACAALAAKLFSIGGPKRYRPAARSCSDAPGFAALVQQWGLFRPSYPDCKCVQILAKPTAFRIESGICGHLLLR